MEYSEYIQGCAFASTDTIYFTDYSLKLLDGFLIQIITFLMIIFIIVCWIYFIEHYYIYSNINHL